jgi:hypothetical protein
MYIIEKMEDPRVDVHIRPERQEDYGGLSDFLGMKCDPITITSHESRYLCIWIPDSDEYQFISHEDIQQIILYDGAEE